jgi:Lon-like protease
VTQKTAAVRAAGAHYFLVPPGEFDEARARAGRGLQVRKVATLEEAIGALRALGGAGLPPPAPAVPA